MEPRAPIKLSPSVTRPVIEGINALIRATPDDHLPAALRGLASEFRGSAIPDAAAAHAVCLLLADLHQQGWVVEARGSEVWLTPPLAVAEEGESLANVKARLRASLVAFRDAQLNDPAVRAFLKRMETRRLYKGRRVSILNLIDDGHSLSVALAEAASLPPSERGAALDRVVRPVLQVASGDARCESTGLLLLDVWRYFRHTWSLEYRPTPGRSMFLLIRNAARPMSPVMGIASLSSPTLQQRVRDAWIGWTSPCLLERISKSPDRWPVQRDSLLRTLREAKEFVRSDDLLASAGAVGAEELESRLLALAEAAAQKRVEMLKQREERAARGEAVEPIKRLPKDADGRTDWRAAGDSFLYVNKRAKTLAGLLFAERILSATPEAHADLASLFRASPDVMRALAIATREVRKVGLASRLLELSVCGAVLPYRDLLGGKLAALAVGSAEVCEWYGERYGGQASEIASQMAGREVMRDPGICVITTTSLYGVAASQYNRLKVHASTPTGPALLNWYEIGLTEGFGTAHMSEETVQVLRNLSVARRKRRNVNNLFGEGQSPRLRQVREALEDLNLDSNEILRHSMPRRIYGLELFEGARERLYLNQRSDVRQPTFQAIAASWRDRWLSRRVTNRDVLMRVAAVGPESVRAELTPLRESPQLSLFSQDTRQAIPSPQEPPRMVIMSKQSNVHVIQSLYRAAAACADHHDEHTMGALHIETPVDSFIRERASGGGVMFVTGNPGDGKTHLLRKLEPALRAAKVQTCLDANEVTHDELISRIDYALQRKGRGLIIAINEGILVQLLRAAEGKDWAEAGRKQLLKPFVYRNEDVPIDPTVAVIDLNLRNNLAGDVVRRALEGLLKLSAPCAGCPIATCDVQRNAQRMMSSPADRISALLDAVAKAGFHATMRDLQGFLAFLLTGGRSCESFKSAPDTRSDYWRCAFEGGQGALFDAVRALDPKDQTLPLLDDSLWRHADQTQDWAVQLPETSPAGQSLDTHREWFINRKRRALFEHTRGGDVLTVAGSPTDRLLQTLLQPSRGAVAAIVRLLNRFFDRDEDRGDLLYLWVTHRYDAQPSRFAAAFASVPSGTLEMLVPKLRPDLAKAFPDYRADHAILCAKGSPPASGLRVDRALTEALYAAGQGLPSMFRRGEPAARIAAFFDKLTKVSGSNEQDDTVDVRLVDMDTGANLQVAVDVAARRYHPR